MPGFFYFIDPNNRMHRQVSPLHALKFGLQVFFGWINNNRRFMDTHIYPHEKEVDAFLNYPDNIWKVWDGLEDLKAKALNNSVEHNKYIEKMNYYYNTS